MYGEGLGRAVDGIFTMLIVSVVVAWPLAIWKVIEILIYIQSNMDITWGAK